MFCTLLQIRLQKTRKYISNKAYTSELQSSFLDVPVEMPIVYLLLISKNSGATGYRFSLIFLKVPKVICFQRRYKIQKSIFKEIGVGGWVGN